MRTEQIPWILLLVTAAHLEGVMGLFFSSKPSALIPDTAAVNSPLLYIYAYQEPTLQTLNQLPPVSVTCDITTTIQDDTDLQRESSPFAINSTGMYIYATRPLEAVPNSGNVTIFLMTVECSSTMSSATLPAVNITVTSFDTWHHVTCAAPTGQVSGNFNADHFCFGDRTNEFDVYENMADVELGEITPSRGPTECRPPSVPITSYLLHTPGSHFKLRHTKLIVETPLDREKNQTVTLSVTCHISGGRDVGPVSRDFTVNVRDIHDCGPVLSVNVGNIPTNTRVITHTLEPGEESRTQPVIFDCDRQTAVTDYEVSVSGDPENVLQVSDVQMSLVKKIVISAKQAPDNDLNATITVRDMTVVSPNVKDSQILIHVFMKGKNGPSPPDGVNENPSSPGTDGSSDVSQTDNNKTQNGTMSFFDPTTGDKPTSQTGSDEIIVDPGYKPEMELPYNNPRQDMTHTTSQWRPTAAIGDKLSTQRQSYVFSKIYPEYINISASAARYTTLLDLFNITSGAFEYQFRRSSTVNPFGISGNRIVYVAENLQAYAGETMRLEVEAINEAQKHNVLVSMQIDILTSSLDVSKDCNRSCASAQNEKECLDMCGFGAATGRCTWRVEPGVTRYSTCVGDPVMCPARGCDKNIEGVFTALCPQDCSNNKNGISINEMGICHCPSPDVCTCYNTAPKIAGSEMAKEDSGGCHKKCRLILSLSLVGGLVMTSCIVILIWRCRSRIRKGSMKHVSSIVSITVPSDYVDDNDRPSGILPNTDWNPLYIDARFKFDTDWEFPRQNLVLDKTLGEGEFGRVVRACATDIKGHKGTQTVAVKMLKECASSTEMRDLISEYTLLKDVSHKNVIKLLGVCSQKGPFYIIVEYCEIGALRDYLRRSRQACYISIDITAGTDDVSTTLDRKIPRHDDPIVTAKDLLSFAWQTAKGMQYLCEMKLVHRDLAARNILIAAGKVIKISDFGLTRDIYEGDAYLKRSKGRIPVKWMAPESLYDQVYTSKSDVWSFGVVLWEIVTLGATPYPGVPPERLYQMLKSGYRMERPQGCSDDLFQVMRRCWREDPAERHSFKYIASQFEAMLSASTSYLDLTYQSERQLVIEDEETTDTTPVANDTQKVNNTLNEDDYGSINILSTDINSYVITPTLQTNGEVAFNNFSREENHSPDSATEETHFLQTLSDQNNKNISDSRLLGSVDSGSETHVLENGV